jgi:hypothetical protein
MSLFCPLAIEFGTVSDWALVLIAATSAIVAWRTYKSNEKTKLAEVTQSRKNIDAEQRFSRKARAYEIWGQYLRLAFEHPELTEKSWTEMVGVAKATGDYTQIEKFEWFTSIMVFSAEEILETCPEEVMEISAEEVQGASDKDAWRNVVKNQIGYCDEYFLGHGERYNNTYSTKLKNLIAEVKKEIDAAAKERKPHPYKQLSLRHSNA